MPIPTIHVTRFERATNALSEIQRALAGARIIRIRYTRLYAYAVWQ